MLFSNLESYDVAKSFFARFFLCSPKLTKFNAHVTRPFCLVESHIVKDAAKAGVLCFTSFPFCNNNISCSLRLNERINIRIHSSVFYLLELAVILFKANFILNI